MKTISIKGSKRESVGKKATKALRNADQVPCVIYGDGEPVHFSAESKMFRPIVYTPKIYITEIEVEGKKYETIMHQLQFHPVSDALLHIDFYQLREGKELTLDIPIKLFGTAKGVKNGGAFLFINRKVSITSIPKKIPDYIRVDVDDLDVEDSFSIGDLEGVEELSINHSDDYVICRVAAPMAKEVVVEEVTEVAEGEEAPEAEEKAEESSEE